MNDYVRILEKALLLMCRGNKDLVTVWIQKGVDAIEIEKELGQMKGGKNA